MTTGKILALLEEGVCREESIRYAFELAKRTNGSVDVLLLFSHDPEGAEEALERSLKQAAASEGVRLTTFVCHGDKASELVKHVAMHSPIDMMVWGGDETALVASRSRRSKHWFARIRGEIEFPVLVATDKAAGR